MKSGGSGGGGGGGGGGEIEEVRKFSLGAEAAGRAALNDWEPRQVFGRSSTGVVMSISRLAAEAEEHYSCLPAEEGAKDKAEALVHDLVTFVQKARAYALQLEKTAPAQAQRLETEAADAVQAVEDQFMEPLKAADSAIKAVEDRFAEPLKAADSAVKAVEDKFAEPRKAADLAAKAAAARVREIRTETATRVHSTQLRSDAAARDTAEARDAVVAAAETGVSCGCFHLSCRKRRANNAVAQAVARLDATECNNRLQAAALAVVRAESEAAVGAVTAEMAKQEIIREKVFAEAETEKQAAEAARSKLMSEAAAEKQAAEAARAKVRQKAFVSNFDSSST